MTTKTLASSLAALAMFAAQGAVEPVWQPSERTAKPTIINAVGFENFALGATPATSDDDSGTADSSKAYFLYSGASGDDQSVVTNHDSFAFNKIPTYFSTLDNGKYLSLSTEGGTLFRSINVISTSGDTPALGQAEPITATGLFVDTLVQFTPCEEPPAFNDADQNKLAVWLGTETNATGDVVGTNLCVRAGYLTYEDGAYGRTSATYTLASASAISVQAGEWVRLTVKAIDNVYTASGLSAQPGFQVYINDELAEFAEAVGSADFLTQLETIDATAKTALDAKTILPSMQAAAELTAVGFQGTGAVDDFVVTTDKPGFLAVDFTLFWDTNIVALETTLNPAPGVSPETTSGAALTKVFASLKNGDVVQVSTALAPTDPEYYEGVTEVASGYEIDWVNTVLTNVTMAAVGGAEDPTGYNFTAVGDGPYSVTLVTKSSTPVQDFDGGSGTEFDPYIVGSAKSFNELVTKVAAGDTFAGKFFELSGNVDFETLGLNPFPGIGVYNSNPTAASAVPFCGTFDGKGYKITNVDFTQRNYAGIFNQVNGGTIKNLTVSNITCSTASSEVSHGEWACAIIGHAANGTTLQNLVAEGSFGTEAIPARHNAAGIAVRAYTEGGPVTFIDCTNNASIFGQYSKVAGILCLCQSNTNIAQTSVLTFTRCVNNGSVKKLSGSQYQDGVDKNGNPKMVNPNGDGGVAGIAAYLSSNGPVVFDSCESLGPVTTTVENYTQLGTMIGHSGKPITLQGTNIARADAESVGDGTAQGFAFATIDNNIATFVEPVFGETVYYCMAANNAGFVLTNAADVLSIDTSLADYAGAVTTTVEGGSVVSNTVRTVTTYSVDTGSDEKTVTPGGSTELEASTAEAATNEAENVTIVVSDAAAEAAGQINVLKKVITYNESTGKYSVEVAIDEKKIVDPDQAVAVVAGVLSGSAASVSIPADKLTPGLYYSLAVATEVDGTYTEGTRTLAAGNEGILFPISKPEGTKAFYKVLVNMLPVSAQ